MSILKIARMGHPVLSLKAEPVAKIESVDIQALVLDMHETMHDAGGAGLAAPQVHVPLRIIVFQDPLCQEAEEKNSSTVLTLINPTLEILDSEYQYGMEACLSLPGLAGEVPRAKRIGYSAITHEGTIIEREAEGFHARVVQHEYDHLDGILYPMRMEDLSTLAFSSELSRISQN